MTVLLGGGAAAADPFDAAGIRARVLAAWSATPARLREDANAEDDLVTAGYRDRLVWELAQNAADAATRAGVPGRLLLRLQERVDAQAPGAVLVAANTGSPLDAEGVQALATLRASAKRPALGEDPAGAAVVGRFGVGFASVVTVADEAAVVSRGGGVRFSAADTRALVAEAALASPGLADELARREGHVPVLRLPFPAEGAPPEGYDTAVLLPLRDGAAVELVRAQLAALDDALLLALPGLAEVVVDVAGQGARRLAGVEERWHVVRAAGTLPAGVTGTRPVERRHADGWSVAWAFPSAGQELPGVLHAPTPTDEPLPWPALLLASCELEPGRRRVLPGPVTDAVLGEAARLYARALGDLAASGQDVLPLVPEEDPASATGWAGVAATLSRALRPALAGTPLLARAGAGGTRDGTGDGGEELSLVRPRDAVVLAGAAGRDPGLVAVLGEAVGGLVLRRVAGDPALERLGVARTGLAELVEALPVAAPPPWWRRLYRAAAPLLAEPEVREHLAAVPVPLAGGGFQAGPRGTVLLDADLPEPLGDAVAALGVRVVHPEAADRALERLGATPADAAALLRLPQVRARVLASLDDDDRGEETATAVLTLVAAALRTGALDAGPPPPGLGWLSELALPDDEGEPSPAGGLVLPGSAAAEVFDPDDVPPVAPQLLDRWGRDVLVAVGVLARPRVVAASDVPLDPEVARAAADVSPGADDVLADLALVDGWDGWVRDVAVAVEAAGGEPATALAGSLVAVADLEAVREQAWPRLLALVGDDPDLRAAVVEPVRVATSAGSVMVEPPAAWWLRRRLCAANPDVEVDLEVDAEVDVDVVDLAPLAVADPAATGAVVRVLAAAPASVAALDPGLRRALGCLRSLTDLDPAAVPALLARLGDPRVALDVADTVAAWDALARLWQRSGVAADPPAATRALSGGAAVVASLDDVLVVDAPMWLQRRDLGPVIAVPAGTTDAVVAALDVVPVEEEFAAAVAESGEGAGEVVAVPAEVAAFGAPQVWCEHDVLRVDGEAVDWWVDAEGGVHAATMDGLARALAWASGRWSRRFLFAELLCDPVRAADLAVEELFG